MSKDRELESDSPRSDFFTLAGIAAALGTSATLGGKTWDLLNPKDPLVVRVVDSRAENGSYVVEFQFHNLDIHAVYIEKIEVKKPLVLTAVKMKAESSFSFGGPAETESPVLPCRIQSGKSREVQLILQVPPNKTSYGVAQFDVSRLGEKSQGIEEVNFLIRHS